MDMIITPRATEYMLDIMTLLLAIWIGIQLVRSNIRGQVGAALNIILAGILVLTVNHLMDTLIFSSLFSKPGFLMDAIVHRSINLVGFILMAIGFWRLSATPK